MVESNKNVCAIKAEGTGNHVSILIDMIYAASLASPSLKPNNTLLHLLLENENE